MANDVFVNPYDGQVMHWSAIHGHNAKNHKPGKWCPTTGNPLDDIALANFDLTIVQSEEARKALYDSLKSNVEKIKAQLAGV